MRSRRRRVQQYGNKKQKEKGMVMVTGFPLQRTEYLDREIYVASEGREVGGRRVKDWG